MISRHKRLIVSFLVISVGCAGAWFYLHGAGESTPPAHGLREAPPIVLKDSSGVDHRLEQFRGKIVLVHFWAGWCPPCLSEIPDLLAFAQRTAGKAPIEVVAVSEDVKWADAEKVLPSSKLPTNFVSLLDVGSKISDQYGTYRFPETYLVNPQGQIVTKWIGAQPWSDPQVEAFLEKQVGG